MVRRMKILLASAILTAMFAAPAQADVYCKYARSAEVCTAIPAQGCFWQPQLCGGGTYCRGARTVDLCLQLAQQGCFWIPGVCKSQR